MRKTWNIATAGLLLFAFAGCNGEKSQTLSRSTAKELIEKTPNALGETGRVSIQLGVPAIRYHDPSSSVLYELNDGFIRDLVKAKVLEPVTVNHEGRDGLGQSFTAYNVIPIKQDGVDVTVNQFYSMTNLNVLLGTGMMEKITGIEQNGPDAIAIVEVVTRPTPLYSRINEAVRSDVETCINKGYQYTTSMVVPCSWPKTIDGSASAQIRFTRYDDGWRLSK